MFDATSEPGQRLVSRASSLGSPRLIQDELRRELDRAASELQSCLERHRRAQESILATWPEAKASRSAQGDAPSVRASKRSDAAHDADSTFSAPLSPTCGEARLCIRDASHILGGDSSEGVSVSDGGATKERTAFASFSTQSLDNEIARTAQFAGIDLAAAQELKRKAHARTDWRGKLEDRMWDVVVWWYQLREPHRHGPLHWFISTSAWQALVALMIGLNSLFMAYSVDYAVLSAGRAVPEAKEEAPLEMQAPEVIFLAFFALELTLRLLVHKGYYFCNGEMMWNLFDFSIVLSSTYDVVISLMFSGQSQGNLSFMRSLRLMRLARTLRMIKLFKYASSLRRMLQSVMGSFVSLFWSFALLVFIFFLFSIATVQGVTSYLAANRGNIDPELDAAIHEHFGSVRTAVLSYFMATSGGNDWSLYYNVLAKTSEVTAALFVFAVGFTQIALLNIMTGVFVENAMKLAQPDRNVMALEQRRASLNDARDLRNILKQLDVDNTGTVTWDEFRSVASDPCVSALLEVMGLDIKDARLMFAMFCETGHSTEVSLDFLVDSFIRMQGPATSIDLQTLAFKTDSIADRVEQMNGRINELLLT